MSVATMFRALTGLATAGFVGLVGIAAPGPASAASAVPQAAVSTAVSIPSFNATMIALINRARQQNGRAPLAEARGLDAVATGWSAKLNAGATGYQLQHDPNAWTEVANSGAANRTSWGENVAWSSSTASSAQTIFNAYMASPGHRANILSASYHYIGMGTAAGSHGLWNATEFTDKVQAGQAIPVPTSHGHIELITGSSPIAKVNFQVRDGSTCHTVLSSWTSPANGIVPIAAKPAAYCIVVTKVPAGYRVPAQQKFIAFWGATFLAKVTVSR